MCIIGENILIKFSKKIPKGTGIEVVYETFDSNEAMEAKYAMVEQIMMLLFQVNIR